MHEHLSALAAKIGKALSASPEYLVTQPAERRILQGISEAEVKDFAKSHGWRVTTPASAGQQRHAGLPMRKTNPEWKQRRFILSSLAL